MLDKLKKYLFRRKTPVVFGDPKRLTPVSATFGTERGTPIDRYYIERFLASHAQCVAGAALEVAEPLYMHKFGGGRVSEPIVLAYGEGDTSEGVLAGDLSRRETLPQARFDCFVCTQTFNFIFEVKAAVEGAAWLLKPGGVLLGTVSGLSQISRYDMERWGDYWRFTDLSTRKLLEPHFSTVEIVTYGNALAASCFLQGVAVEDLPDRQLLDIVDPDYQLTIGFKAVK